MILVTGATGNVGGEVVRALIEAGHQVRALIRSLKQSTHPPGIDESQVLPTVQNIIGKRACISKLSAR